MSIYFSHREVNPISGASEAWYWDPDNERFHIKSTHDVTDILAANKRQANASLDTRYGKEALHHVAEIPNAVIVKLKREFGIDIFDMNPDMQRKFKRLLDDPEWRYLKTTVKKLSR